MAKRFQLKLTNKTMHILTITTNSRHTSDSVSLSADNLEGEGWLLKIEESNDIRFVIPKEVLPVGFKMEKLLELMEEIHIEGEPSFKGGLIIGFLEANYSGKEKLSDAEYEEASKFLEFESADFPHLVDLCKKEVHDWLQSKKW